MVFIGYNCSDCLHSLLSDFCRAFAANLLLECDLLTVGLFGKICDFKILEGICNTNGVLKYGLTVEIVGANCGASGNHFLDCSDCIATVLV